MFSSDVVAFDAIFPFYMQRKSEEKTLFRGRGWESGSGLRFTQHFVEHCAILVCSSHNVDVGDVGGVAGGNVKKKKNNPNDENRRLAVVSRETVRTQHASTRPPGRSSDASAQGPLPPRGFLSPPLARTVPASEVSGSVR